MVDFSNLNKYDVTNEHVARLTLYSITLANGVSPTLIGRPCGQVNKAYFNALMRSSAKRALQSASRQNLAATEAHRRVDRVLYPRHVLTGWEDMVDANGDLVSFSEENCTDFIRHLPDHIFDEVRAFFLDLGNFTEEAVSVEEAIEKGNS